MHSDCPMAYRSLVPKPSWNDGAVKSSYFLNSSIKIIQSAAVQHQSHDKAAASATTPTGDEWRKKAASNTCSTNYSHSSKSTITLFQEPRDVNNFFFGQSHRFTVILEREKEHRFTNHSTQTSLVSANAITLNQQAQNTLYGSYTLTGDQGK